MADITIPVGGQSATISIPDFAMESTMQDILSIQRRMLAEIAGVSGGSGSGSGGSDNLERALNANTREQEKAGVRQTVASRIQNSVISGSAMQKTPEASTIVEKSLSRIGLGALAANFGAMVGVMEEYSDAIGKAMQVGIGFTTDFTNLRTNVSAIGLSMGEFGKISIENSEAIRGFGDSTDDGAGRLVNLTREFRDASRAVGYFGMNSFEMTQLMADELEIRRATMGQDQLRRMNEAELAAATSDNLKVQTAMAALTGQDVRDRLKAQNEARKDVIAQSFLRGQSDETREKFKQLASSLSSIPGGDAIAKALLKGVSTGLDPRQFADEMFAMLSDGGQSMIDFVKQNLAGGMDSTSFATGVQELANNLTSSIPAEQLRIMAATGNETAKSLLTIETQTIKTSDLVTDFNTNLEKLNNAVKNNFSAAGIQADLEETSRLLANAAVTAVMASAGIQELGDMGGAMRELAGSFNQGLGSPQFLALMEGVGGIMGTMSGLLPLLESLRGNNNMAQDALVGVGLLGQLTGSDRAAMVAFAAALGPENMAGIVDKLGEGIGLDGFEEVLQPLIAALTNFNPVGDVANAIRDFITALRATTN